MKGGYSQVVEGVSDVSFDYTTQIDNAAATATAIKEAILSSTVIETTKDIDLTNWNIDADVLDGHYDNAILAEKAIADVSGVVDVMDLDVGVNANWIADDELVRDSKQNAKHTHTIDDVNYENILTFAALQNAGFDVNDELVDTYTDIVAKNSIMTALEAHDEYKAEWESKNDVVKLTDKSFYEYAFPAAFEMAGNDAEAREIVRGNIVSSVTDAVNDKINDGLDKLNISKEFAVNMTAEDVYSVNDAHYNKQQAINAFYDDVASDNITREFKELSTVDGVPQYFDTDTEAFEVSKEHNEMFSELLYEAANQARPDVINGLQASLLVTMSIDYNLASKANLGDNSQTEPSSYLMSNIDNGITGYLNKKAEALGIDYSFKDLMNDNHSLDFSLVKETANQVSFADDYAKIFDEAIDVSPRSEATEMAFKM